MLRAWDNHENYDLINHQLVIRMWCSNVLSKISIKNTSQFVFLHPPDGNHLSKLIKSWTVTLQLACQWEKMSSICYRFVFHIYVVVIQLMLHSMWIVTLLLQAPYKKDMWMISPASPQCSLCGIYAYTEEIELGLPWQSQTCK